MEKQVLRGFIANIKVVPPLIVTFQFNPETIKDNKDVHYTGEKGDLSENATSREYVSGGYRTIAFEFKLHGLERGLNTINPTPIDNGISTELAKLRSFLYPADDAWAMLSLGGPAGKRLSAPPGCIFGFGTKVLDCVVTDLSITETQFNSVLAPVRADVSITLTVNEGDGFLYELDKQHRNVLATLGLQNIRI